MFDSAASKGTAIKVYIVLQLLVNVPGDRPNVKVLSVWLNRKSADEMAARKSRSWVERHLASKYDNPKK
jgi:hypothetical protein